MLNNPSSRNDPLGLESEECKELREQIAELKGLIREAFRLKEREALPVLQYQLKDFQAEYDEKCEDDGPDGDGQPQPESCPLSEPNKQAASASLMTELLILGGLGAGLAFGL